MIGSEGTAEQSFGGEALHLAALMARLCGWRPEDFWSATPAEVCTVLMGFGAGADADALGAGAGLGRGRLAAMMEAFPDG